MDQDLSGLSGICMAVHDHFKEHLCIRSDDRQGRHAVEKICGAHRGGGRHRDDRRRDRGQYTVRPSGGQDLCHAGGSSQSGGCAVYDRSERYRGYHQHKRDGAGKAAAQSLGYPGQCGDRRAEEGSGDPLGAGGLRDGGKNDADCEGAREGGARPGGGGAREASGGAGAIHVRQGAWGGVGGLSWLGEPGIQHI